MTRTEAVGDGGGDWVGWAFCEDGKAHLRRRYR